MSKHTVNLEAEVEITINDPDVIERVTGPDGDDWRHRYYDLYTKTEVLEHLAHNAFDVNDACKLDGWTDCEPGAATMRVASLQGE